MRRILRKIPVIGPLMRVLRRVRFPGSERYWMERYAKGGHSGAGSYEKLAEFKAEVLNKFVAEYGIQTIIEYGCGDGNQLRLAKYPDYTGFDVSPIALSRCREIFGHDRSKRFKLMKDYNGERAQLSLSLDVLYHLVEDGVFESYMKRLFDSSDRYVIIYSSNTYEQSRNQDPHVRHREFTNWLDENMRGWKLIQHIPSRYPVKGDIRIGSLADFFVYEKEPTG